MEELILSAIERLEELGVVITSNIKSAVEFLYPMVVRRVIFRGIISLLLGIGLGYIGKKFFNYIKKQYNDYGWDEEGGLGVCVFFLILLLTIIIIFIYSGLNNLINYELESIKSMLRLVTNW